VELVVAPITILVCLLTGKLLDSVLPVLADHPNDRFSGLDGLRGFLALAVFFHHFLTTYHWKITSVWRPPDELIFANFGPVGISLFFMITGFLFTGKTLLPGKKTNWKLLFRNRFLRIFPLYLFVVLINAFIAFQQTNFEFLETGAMYASETVLWLTFIGFPINTYLPSENLVLAGTYWTLKYEWFFYLSLPILVVALSVQRPAVLGLIGLLSLAGYIWPQTFLVVSTKFFALFAIGGLIYLVRDRLQQFVSMYGQVFASVLSLSALLVSLISHTYLGSVQVLAMTMFFGLIVGGTDIFGLLKLRSARYLGEISYSIYLVHGIVLFLGLTLVWSVDAAGLGIQRFIWLMPPVGVVVVIVCSFTYLLIERPFLQLSRRRVDLADS